MSGKGNTHARVHGHHHLTVTGNGTIVDAIVVRCVLSKLCQVNVGLHFRVGATIFTAPFVDVNTTSEIDLFRIIRVSNTDSDDCHSIAIL